jgi:hypothetical protein
VSAARRDNRGKGGEVRAKEGEDVGLGKAGRDKEAEQEGESEGTGKAEEEEGRSENAESNDQALASRIGQKSLKDVLEPHDEDGMPLQQFPFRISKLILLH